MGDPGVHQASGPSHGRRDDNLAMLFQEVLTVIVRLRADRQPVSDPQAFRRQITGALTSIGEEATRRSYSGEDTRVATFAIVAFLDESILNSGKPAFADWLRTPLQQQLFGVHEAGDIYFRNIERLLARSDSQELADVLEVYQLCLLLGFRGRHSAGSVAELRAVTQSITEKIRRIRGRTTLPFFPHLAPPGEAPRPLADPWLRRFLWGAAACWTLAVLLFVVYKLSLNSASGQLHSIVTVGRF
jgi:type VI secretion system protein ImpK